MLIVFIVSTLLCLVERWLFGRDFGVHICSFPQGIALFLLGCANPRFGKGSLLTRFGRRYSMFIYILHPFIMRVIPVVYRWLRLSDFLPAAYLKPILVLAVTIAMSAVVLWLNKYLREIAARKRQETP